MRLGFLTHVQGRGDGLAQTYRNAQNLFIATEIAPALGWKPVLEGAAT